MDELEIQGSWMDDDGYLEETTIGTLDLDPKNLPHELEIDGHTYIREDLC